MIKNLSIIFSFFIATAFAAEYEISLLNLDQTQKISYNIYGSNDKGQLLINCYDYIKNTQKACVYDHKKGLICIDTGKEACYSFAINNNGQVLGQTNKPFIWSKTLGIRPLEFTEGRLYPRAFNDLGQIIGSYHKNNANHSFLWDYGVVTEMGPGSVFAAEIETLGYHVLNLELVAINNKGELVGYFNYGKYNQRKNEYVRIGTKSFFWNGEMFILPLQIESNYDLGKMKLNLDGDVMIDCSQSDTYLTYVWHAEKGIKELKGIRGYALNDSGTVIGEIILVPRDRLNDREAKIAPVLWREGSVVTLASLLDVEDLENLAPAFSDDYAVERIFPLMKINNIGEVPCNALIWGDLYPCVLRPKKNLR